MVTEANGIEVELEQTEGDDAELEESGEVETQEEGEGEAEEKPAKQQEEAGELQVSIGEEPEVKQVKESPEWVKELRKQHRLQAKRIRELEAAAAAREQGVKLPEKPKLDQYDYDEVKFEQAMDAYYAAKASHDAKAAQIEAQRQQEYESAVQKRARYTEASQALKVSDYKDAEDEVINALSEAQQGMILSGADRPELLVYALGKNPAKLHELASIKDPVRFAFAASKLEKDLKVSNRKSESARPETTVKTTAATKATSNTLERLREEAMRTGDMTKVLAFKQKMRKSS